MSFVFCRLYPPPSPATIALFGVYLSSLLLTKTVSLVQVCQSIRLEMFRGSQKEDEPGPVGIWFLDGRDTISTCTPYHISTESLSPQHTHPSRFRHLINHSNILLILILTETFCIRIGLCLSLCLELSVFVQIFLIPSRDSVPLSGCWERVPQATVQVGGEAIMSSICLG
jgi:hypothetical protein